MNQTSGFRESISDRELVELVKQGDDPGFYQLVERHAQALFNLINLVIPDSIKAQAVLHDSLYLAYMAFPNYKGEIELRNWLIKIAVIQSVHRSNGNNVISNIDSTLMGFNELDNSERLILFFKYVLQLSVMEMADILVLTECEIAELLEEARFVLVGVEKAHTHFLKHDKNNLCTLLNQYFDGSIREDNQVFLLSKLNQQYTQKDQAQAQGLLELNQLKLKIEKGVQNFKKHCQRNEKPVDFQAIQQFLTERIQTKKPNALVRWIVATFERLNNPRLAARIQWGFAIGIFVFFSLLGFIVYYQIEQLHRSAEIHATEPLVNHADRFSKNIMIKLDPKTFHMQENEEHDLLEIITETESLSSPDEPIQIEFYEETKKVKKK